jgi:hypothetical protein
MTRDEIIKLATEADLWGGCGSQMYGENESLADALVKFAGLVEAAHEVKALSAYSRGYACGVAAGDATVESALRERDTAYKDGAAAGRALERLRLKRIVWESAQAFGKPGECMEMAMRVRIDRGE